MSASPLLTLEAAWASVAARVKKCSMVPLPLHKAVGHVLAEDVCADRDIPAADRSSMDGYAFARRMEDQAPLRLHIRGEVQAGVAPSLSLTAGECVRIFTGALLPVGADTVVMQEDTTVDREVVTLSAVPPKSAYVLGQGTDARAGDRLAAAGSVISPLHVALCAAVGAARVSVIRKPKVAVLTTGEELRDAGAFVEPHQIRDSNSFMIQAQLRAAGFDVGGVERTGDDEAKMAAAAESLLESSDVLVMIGGMSVGRYDYGPAALRRMGATIHFHRVRARPGKPQLFATKEDRLIFGLPGNPLSVMVGLHELVLPALRTMSGFTLEACRRSFPVRLAAPVEGLEGLVNFRPSVLQWTETGPEATVLAMPRSSADLVTASAATGFVVVPPEARLKAGDWLAFRPWMNMP